uniref:CKLF-like MARVEL transmembrane domain-containing protein 6 isoform X1 n=1 Tax=Semicossyphus pulcher TaxID=241346 RepID=UPI0037E9A045
MQQQFSPRCLLKVCSFKQQTSSVIRELKKTSSKAPDNNLLSRVSPPQLFSFLAFILEEVVNSCISCTALYFFEFVSCTAFLFTLLLLILLSTNLHSRVGITCWPRLDFAYTAGIAVLFLIASIVFASDNRNTSVENGAVVFGFMATIAFFADLGWFMKTSGFPFKKDQKPELSNGGTAPVEGQPESEKLTNGTEGV